MGNENDNYFTLSQSQIDWLKLMAIPHDRPYDRYKKEGGVLSKGRYDRFLETEKSPRYSGVPVDEAKRIMSSLGLSMDMLDAVKLITEQSIPRPNNPFINSLESMLKRCGDFLWNGTGTTADSDQSQESLVIELVKSVLSQDKKISQDAHTVVLEELCDYMLENRMFHEYKDCLWGLMRKVRTTMCEKGYSWFPGCATLDRDALPVIDIEITDGLSETQFDEAANFVRCVNMQIEAVRSAKFLEKLEFEDLSLKTLSRYLDQRQIADCNNDLKKLGVERDEKKKKGLRKKTWLRGAFAEVEKLIKPIWLEVNGKSTNPHRWKFLGTCARLFYDWARYHWYSLDRCDVKKATDMYKLIYEMAVQCDSNSSSNGKVKSHFMYMASTASRYMAEATSSGKWGNNDNRRVAVGYVQDALFFAQRAMEHASHESSRALLYKTERNLARIQTFAVRWWLKHGAPDMTKYSGFIDKNKNVSSKVRDSLTKVYAKLARDYGAERHSAGKKDKLFWGINQLEGAVGHIETTLRSPFGPDERNNGGSPILLKGKRLLEWEFHLRVQIEAIIAWLSNDSDAVRHNEGREDSEGAAHLNINNDKAAKDYAYAAFAQIILIYEYLCRGVTHLPEASLEWAKRYVYKKVDPVDIYFSSIKELDKTRQNEPPSITCRLEIISSILYSSFPGGLRAEPTWLYKTLKDIGSNDAVITQALNELENDLDDILSALKEENFEFCLEHSRDKMDDEAWNKWFNEEEGWKDLPAFRHLDELIWGPGSNAEECERMFSSYGLDWNCYGKGDCHA